MPVGASVADWLSTVVAFQMGKASADANRRKTSTLRYLTMCHLLGDSKCTCVRIRIEGLRMDSAGKPYRSIIRPIIDSRFWGILRKRRADSSPEPIQSQEEFLQGPPKICRS